jgi:hypothetical protein
MNAETLPARAARGTSWEQRLLPANAVRDGVHQTWYDRSNAKDQALHKCVASKLGLTRHYVRQVALSVKHSESVLAALKKESERLCDGRVGILARQLPSPRWPAARKRA